MRLMSVTTMIPTRSGFAWFPCEVDLPADISDAQAVALCQQTLIENGSIAVTKLELENGDGRTRIIRGRVPTLFGEGMIGMIQPLNGSEYVEG